MAIIKRSAQASRRQPLCCATAAAKVNVFTVHCSVWNLLLPSSYFSRADVSYIAADLSVAQLGPTQTPFYDEWEQPQ